MLDPLGVPDKQLAQSNIGHSWGYGNQITIFPTDFSYPAFQTSQVFKNTNLFSLIWETALCNPHVRKLANESCGTFMAIQNGVLAESPSKLMDLVKFSHQYRCIINACIEDLNQAADSGGNENKSQEDLEMSEVFYKAELVWNLCEIIYLEKPSGILPGLLEWIQIHFPSPIVMAETVMTSSNPACHPNYWNAVFGLVFQLRLDSAIKLLKLHPDANVDSFLSACELLKKMPIFGVNASVSIPEFTFRWNHWRDECESRVQTGDFIHTQELETLVKILCGREEVFSELEFLFETWYQRMITQLTFTNPTISVSTLSGNASQFLSDFQSNDQATVLDSILLAILRRDTRKMIGEMQTVFDNCWFSAHLADLLYHADALQSFEDNNSLQLRESLLRDYALCLFSHSSLWTVGVLYLDHCPTLGLATLEHLLPRLSFHSEFKANKILAIAQERQLTSVATSVCRMMGRRALTNKRLGAAVAWAVRAQDATLATHAADAVLKNYLKNSDFTSTDLLESLGAGLLASDRLAFLGKYHEFHRLYLKNDFRNAAALLISLISSRIAPKYFWSVLLMDALPLLETNPPVFTAEQTYELMQSLQELTASFQDDEDEPISHPDRQLNSDKTMLITLALSRNLAKCFVQQSVTVTSP